jgi:MFS family permease
LVYLAGGYNIVVAGAYARQIGIALGGADKTTWLVQIVTIIIAVLSPPISEAADLWGRKWLLVVLSGLGVVSAILGIKNCF